MHFFSPPLIKLVERSKTMKRIGSLVFHESYPLLCFETNFLPLNVMIAQRLWHVEHNINTIILCKQCNVPAPWNIEKRTYRTYCSSKCANSDFTVMDKRRATNLTKYGCVSPLGNSDVRIKIKKTTIDRYGVDNISQSEETKLKKQTTCMLNFGVAYPRQCKTIKEQSQQTCLEKYGHTNVLASEYGKAKTKQTLNALYGKDYTNQQHISTEILCQLNDKDWLYNEHVVLKQSLTQIANNLKINDTTVGKYLHQHGIITQLFFTSMGEQEIRTFVDSLKVETCYNVRDIIPPYELDIYIPKHGLAIEYCGLYWHSEQRGKHRQYHETKYKKCKEQNIQLLTIFEDEWSKRQEQIKQKILYLLKQSTITVYARNTTVVALNTTQKDQFLEINHIQGTGPGSVTYGLIYNTQVVAVMSFIKQPNNEYVLNRYATNCSVPGGFSKLLKHFQQNNHWRKITSFADLRWSNGNLYEATGWTLDKILPPDYSYSPDGHVRLHKFNYRRKNLPKLLKTFDPKLSETQNCDANNILRIWDCGKLRYVIKNQFK